MANSQTNPVSQNRNFMLIGVLLMIVGLGSVYEFLAPRLKGTRDNLAAANSQLTGVETDIKVLTNAKSQLQQAEDVMQQQKGVDFTKLPLVYPAKEDIPGLYLQLEAIVTAATNKGIVTPVYQVAPPIIDPTDGAARIPLTVSAVGSYLDLKQFIASLELNLRPLSIQTINLAQTLDKDKGTPSGEFTLNLAGYVRAEALSAAYTTPAS